MRNGSLSESINHKSQMAKVLFWIFVAVFSITATFAFVALAIVFIFPERAEQYTQFTRLTWALWGVVLAEVAAGILALWNNIFGLSSESEIATARNIVGEIIDGLESNGDITEDKAEHLRKQYFKTIGSAPENSVLVLDKKHP